MCGIIGVLCVEAGWESKSVLYQGIMELLNRGYDSVGISFLDEEKNKIRQIRTLRIDDVLEALQKERYEFRVGMAHTRWATHGGVCIENAHPHIDTVSNTFALIHNGIIENFMDHKVFLESRGVVFRSGTDSEVIVNMIAYYVSISSTYPQEPDPEKRLENIIRYVLELLEGTYGLVIQCLMFPSRLYCARKGSPILLGITPDGRMGLIASEKSAFCGRVEKYVSLHDNSLHRIHISDEGRIQHDSIGADQTPSTPYEIRHCQSEESLMTSLSNIPNTSLGKKGEHTLMEIYQQPRTVQRCLRYGARFTSPLQGKIKIGGLDPIAERIRGCKNFYFFGCGTSYHAAQLAVYFFKKWTSVRFVQAIDGSEFLSTDLPKKNKDEERCCSVFISQSGETLDLFNVLKLTQDPMNVHLGIINVVDSMIARTVEAGVYMGCGKERGVASTKTFTSSVIIGWLMAHWYAGTVFPDAGVYTNFHNVVEEFLPYTESVLDRWIHQQERFKQTKSMFILGKGMDFFIAHEGALKIKELCRIHAEAYPSGALKHGPFALLDETTPVFMIMTDPEGAAKCQNAIHEIRSRNAPVYVITSLTNNNDNDDDQTLVVPSHPWSFLLAGIVFQLLSVRLSLSLGFDPDFPRNLAKVVTVE